MRRCGACQDGPRGIEGHDDLFARTMDGRRMQFVCRGCGAVWVRHYNGAGSFNWESLGAQLQGTAVPGARKGPTGAAGV